MRDGFWRRDSADPYLDLFPRRAVSHRGVGKPRGFRADSDRRIMDSRQEKNVGWEGDPFPSDLCCYRSCMWRFGQRQAVGSSVAPRFRFVLDRSRRMVGFLRFIRIFQEKKKNVMVLYK